MDNMTARLELFRQAINSQADAEAAELTRQYEEKRSALDKEKSERSSGAALSEINAERSRTAAQFRKELSRCEFDRKNAVLAHRNQLLEQLFSDISEKLSDWTCTPEYTAYLSRALEKAQQELGTDIVILARSADVAAVKALTSLPVQEEKSIMLGGISASCPAKGLYADFTLDSRLAARKAEFPRRGELRL